MKQKRIDTTNGKWIRIVGVISACGILFVLAFNAFSAVQLKTESLQHELQTVTEARDSAIEEVRSLELELDKISKRFATARENLVEFKVRSTASDVLANELMEEIVSGALFTPMIEAAAEYCIREEYLLFQDFQNGEREAFSDDQVRRYSEFSRYLRGDSSARNPVNDFCMRDVGGSFTKIASDVGLDRGERIRERFVDRVFTLCLALDVQVYEDFDDWDSRYFTSDQIERYEQYIAVKDTDEDAHPSADYCLDMFNSISSEVVQINED